MSDDNNRHSSDGLVPDLEAETSIDQLDDERPDTFDEPMAEDYLENELPEEGVTSENIAFEEDLERDLQEGATEGGDASDAGGEPPEGEYARHDTDYEQAVEDEEIKRYGEDRA